MADFSRIRAVYEKGLEELSQQVVSELDLSPTERDHVLVLQRLLEAILEAYGSFHVDQEAGLDVSTSVMYASAAQAKPQILNVPLRSLVDSSSVSPWQARFLNGSIRLRRTILVSGPQNTGKSTLLNALVHLISLDAQVVSIEDEQRLPALRNRSFTVTLRAKSNTPAFAAALTKMGEMKPAFALAGELKLPQDSLAFLRAVRGGICGLGTVSTPDPDVLLAEWLAGARDVLEIIADTKPLLAFMQIDPVGRPRLVKLIEMREIGGTVRFLEQKPTT